MPVALAVVALLIVPTASAHSPLSAGSNESLATATVVHDPTKSWAVYAHLHEGGEAQYYRFDLAAGQPIFVQLLVSTSSADRGFTPGLVLMGPGLADNGTAPAYVERANGTGAQVHLGVWPDRATYEAFAPSSFFELGRVTMPAPASGTYYLAVFEPTRGGDYGLAIGERESFTASEWVMIPFSVMSVYVWEGQNPAFILLPATTIVAAGVGLIAWRRRDLLAPRSLAAALAGLLFLGSGATVLSQMAVSLNRAPAGAEVVITLALGSVPILIGVGTLRIALSRDATWGRRRRVKLVILGLLGVFGWAGWLVGPTLAVLAGALPALPVREARPAPQP